MYRENGKEHGNYYIGVRYTLVVLSWVLWGKWKNGNYHIIVFRDLGFRDVGFRISGGLTRLTCPPFDSDKDGNICTAPI